MKLSMRLIAAAVSPGMPDFGEQISGTHRQWLHSDEKRAALRRSWADWFELSGPARLRAHQAGAASSR